MVAGKENDMTKAKFLRYWSVAVGSMDALTGLLLIFVPALVLRMLGITPPAGEVLVFISWVGVFVMSVGLSYGLALGKRGWGEAVWIFTSLVRIMVAVFLTTRILDGSLAKAWALVALADASVALVQMAIVRAKWWREVYR